MSEFYIVAGGRINRMPIPNWLMERMAERHFRGANVAKAGNFCQPWSDIIDVLAEFEEELSAEIDERLKEGDSGVMDVTIEHEYYVGWATTAPLDAYLTEELEKHDFPNGKGSALFVKADHQKLTAPLTKSITFIYSVEDRDDGGPVIKLISAYPGESPGELAGDVSDREQVVFFDWEHPGQPLHETAV